MKKNLSRILEVIFILVASFIVIMLVFLGLNFGFSKTKTLTGQVSAEDTGLTNSPFEWIIITIVSAIVVVAILEYIIKKRFFKIKWNLN